MALNNVHWTYHDNWTPSCRSWMGGFLENVFFREAPMSPSEVPDLIQSMEIQHCMIWLATGYSGPITSPLPADCLSFIA